MNGAPIGLLVPAGIDGAPYARNKNLLNWTVDAACSG